MKFNIKLKPKEEKFFRYLKESTQLIRCGADMLYETMITPEAIDGSLESIDELQVQAEAVNAKLTVLLNKAFILQFDREDIYAMSQQLEYLMGAIKESVERMALYHQAGPVSEGARNLAELTVKAAKQLDKVVEQFPELKKQRAKIEERCARIAWIEEEGDRIYRQEMAYLFRQCQDPVEIIKWKEILSNLEETLDLFEDIAKLIGGVILKYA